MKSMTGFAQGRFDLEKFSLNISFKSLNHRFLDISYKGTGISPVSEKIIKEVLKNKLNRGKVEVIFDLFEMDSQKWQIQFNEPLFIEILNRINKLNKKIVEKENVHFSIDSLLKIPMIFRLDYVFNRFSKKDLANIRKSLETVFKQFLQSRTMEGDAILRDLLICSRNIDNNIKFLEKSMEKIEKDIFREYKKRIEKLLMDSNIEEKRIVQETAIIAEKICIAEEINRLKTHNKRLRDLLQDDKISVKGKEADFLSQEMQRETRTIAAKTNSLNLHRRILLIRREIEKIRQQVQNVE